jgi:hypothetical protein
MAIEKHRHDALRAARLIGGLSLLVDGGVHLEQYTAAHFSAIPTIGPLFLLNVVSASALALILLVPIGRSARRGRVLLDSIVGVSGIGVAAGALAALFISEQRPLFGFMEHGYRLEIVIAIAAEVIAILSLGVQLAIADRWAHELSAKVTRRDPARDTTAPSSPAEA